MKIKNIKITHFLVIATLLLVSISSFSQNFKSEKRIYLLDITGSMWGVGKGEDIFNKVKKSLIQTINSLDNPETKITVITFGKGVEDIWEAKATIEGKKSLIASINTYDNYEGKDIQKATNICDALTTANDKIENNMLNYLFLYTDGGHNFPNGNLQCVKDIVNVICEKNNRTDDVYPFYIMLTEKANSSDLRNALKCFKIVEGCSTPDIVVVKTEKNKSSINLLENKLSTVIKFVSNRSSSLLSKVKLELTLAGNENFKLKKTEYTLSQKLGKITIDFVAKRNISQVKSILPLTSELNLKINISYLEDFGKCKTIEMRPENMTIYVINKREKTVTITVIKEEN
jgi:hypothetical protein